MVDLSASIDMTSKLTGLAQSEWEQLAAWRGIAALLVAIGHMVQVFIYPGSVWLAPYSGLLAQASVMVFFVVSGCSIAASAVSISQKSHPIRRYILHRLVRIWPPLLFSMALIYCLSLFAPLAFPTGSVDFMPGSRLAREGLYLDWQGVGMALLFLNGFFGSTINSNGPLWSLSYEVWLYFIFYFFLIGLKTRYKWLSAMSIIAFLILASLHTYGERLLFARYSLVWAAGTAVYLFLCLPSDFKVKNLLAFPAALVGLFAIYYGRAFIVTDMNEEVWPFNVMFGLFFAIFLAMRISIPRFLKNFGKKIAAFAYTLYLIHFPIYLFLFGAFQEIIVGSSLWAWVVAVLALINALIISYYSGKFFENRAIFLKIIKLE